jgi:probable HAF family extracellular repeat protein
MKPFSSGVVALGLLFGEAALAHGDYLFTTLDAFSANGINDADQIVGNAAFGGFLYSGGNYTPINVPTPDRLAGTSPQGINNSGQIVGCFEQDRNSSGFLLSDGTYHLFQVPGTTATFAAGINTSGQIVGSYSPSALTNEAHGFLLTAGNYTTLDVPGSSFTGAGGINDRGDIVGEFGAGQGSLRGFLLSGGSYTTIDVPGSLNTVTQGINNEGDIVGIYEDTNKRDHGFLLSNGNFTTIDVPGAMYTNILGINNLGQLVGTFDDPSGNSHAFLATPIPEPASLVLIAIGALGLIAYVLLRMRRPHRRYALLYTDGQDTIAGFDPGSQQVPITP